MVPDNEELVLDIPFPLSQNSVLSSGKFNEKNRNLATNAN